jgi:hypothetical protein
METNQTAAELAKEYEQLAIAATNDYCRLKRHQPEEGFPAVARSINFYGTMHLLWQRIARKLAEGPAIYPSGDIQPRQRYTYEGGTVVDWPTGDTTPDSYDEFGA